jgi:PAS domain S-box-containing protein
VSTQKDKVDSMHHFASQNIRATHDIIVDIEKSKDSMESFVNNMPEIFAMIDRNGNIIRGNLALANLFKCDIESVLDRSMKSLFKAETWNIFQEKVLQTDQLAPETAGIGFELPVDVNEQIIDCIWNMSRYNVISQRRGPVFVVIGRDVTEIRAYERKLAKVFAAVPLGILTVNVKGEIEAPYSAYIEYLLEARCLDGKDAKEAIFSRSWGVLSKLQRDGIDILFKTIGDDEMWFDTSVSLFPTEIPVPFYNEDGTLKDTKWFGLTYNPIVHSGNVEKMLIVIENITDRVKSRDEKETRTKAEKKIAQNYLDITGCEETLLVTSMWDLTSYADRIADMIKQDDPPVRQICNLLHGFKGVARAAGFTHMMDMAHSTEQQILTALEQNKPGLRLEAIEVTEKHLVEWYEFSKLANGLYNSSKSNNGRWGMPLDATMPIAQLEPQLELLVTKTAEKLGKDVQVHYAWQDINIPSVLKTSISEILIHLCNNAIDHGIEPLDIRRNRGKPDWGNIYIEAEKDDTKLRFRVSDDGGGLNPRKILRTAIAKKVVAEEEGAKLSNPEIYRLLLLHGFSMTDKVTEISGRGIGLDAVNDRVKSIGSKEEIKIMSDLEKGTMFEFVIDMRKNDEK